MVNIDSSSSIVALIITNFKSLLQNAVYFINVKIALDLPCTEMKRCILLTGYTIHILDAARGNCISNTHLGLVQYNIRKPFAWLIHYIFIFQKKLIKLRSSILDLPACIQSTINLTLTTQIAVKNQHTQQTQTQNMDGRNSSLSGCISLTIGIMA